MPSGQAYDAVTAVFKPLHKLQQLINRHLQAKVKAVK
jgi:hypothetical protein